MKRGGKSISRPSPPQNGYDLENMMFRLGAPELLILLGIVILLFGVGRIGKIASELGSGLKAFKDNLQGESKE